MISSESPSEKYSWSWLALMSTKGSTAIDLSPEEAVRVCAGARGAAVRDPQLPPIPNSCQVLNLVLGPINLNLLGLSVRTNQINLRIDAVPGAGNLLGNLLCGILGILNPPTGGTGGLSGAQLAQLLNAILGALTPVLGG